MKKMKRLAALFLAVVMIMAMGLTAMAANDGSITIKNATFGDSYQVYKVFDATFTVTNGKTHAAYTATEDQKNWFEGEDGNPFTFTETKAVTETGSKLYNVSVAETVTKQNITDFFAKYRDYSTDATTGKITYSTDLKDGLQSQVRSSSEVKEATSSEVKFENLSYGYYLVASTMGATVSLDTTTKDAIVIDKNQKGPSVDEKEGKKIVSVNDVDVSADSEKENTVNYGDKIKFKLTINTTNYDHEKMITNYNIKDTLPGAMTADTDKMTVKVIPTKGTEEQINANTKTLEKTDYTVEKGTNEFTVKIPWTNEANNVKTSKYVSPAKIEIEYVATVGNTADPNVAMINKVSFTYNVEGETDPQTPTEGSTESETKSYTYALAVNKVTENGTGLADAKFKITKGAATILVQATNEDGVYNYVGIATEDQVKAANEASKDNAGIIVKSPANGLIVVKGINADTYTITETEAPAGYNLMTKTENVETVLNGTYTKTITIYWKTDTEGHKTITNEVTNEKIRDISVNYDVAPKTIVNTTGAVLPSTGGIGTTIFYVVGGIMVLGAGVLLITKKRMSAK